MLSAMGTHERRQREKDEVRAMILDAARELFAKEGFDAVTMRKVADRIEYSATALYLYFPDKDALIRALCDQDFRAFAATFTSVREETDIVGQLRRAGELYAEFALTHPQHFRLMFMTPPPAGESVLEKGNPEEDAYALLRLLSVAAIDAGRVCKGMSDPDELAQLLWSSTHGVVSLNIAKCNAGWVELKDARVLANRMIDVAFAALLRPGDPEQVAATKRLAAPVEAPNAPLPVSVTYAGTRASDVASTPAKAEKAKKKKGPR